MINKFTKSKRSTLLAALTSLCMFLPAWISAQVNVTASAGTASASYLTLKESFDAINAGTHMGAISIDISASTTETATAVLFASGTGSSSYSNILIVPSGGAARTISGAMTAGVPLIDLNGADNVKIDGLYFGGNSLTISNTTASGTTGTSTIRLIGGATSNTITNCFVLGSFSAAVGTNGGNIFFSTDANTTNGNDNNVISYCNIGPAGSNLPTKGIYMNGSTTTTAINNSGNTILNNYIFDYFGAAVSSAGIYIGGGNTDINIANNLFYQTSPKTQTTGAQHSAVWILNTSGNNFQVTGNVIGYASSSQTGIYSFTGVSGSSVFIPVFLSVGTATASNASGNLIDRIAMTGTLSGTSSSASFRGIYVASGLASCNTNTIGSQSSSGSITFSSGSTSAADVIGIFNFGSSNFVSNNNVIGGFTLSNSSTGATNFYGLRVNTASGVTWTCNNNVIGGNFANSIDNTSTAVGSIVNGILNSNPSGTFANNIIRNLSSAGGTGTGSSASLAGIVINATSANHTLTANSIYNLNSSLAGAAVVNGINYSSSTGSNVIEKNLIYSLNGSNTASIINGINIVGGTATYKNNMIRLGAIGSSSTIGMQINGINETAAGTNNIWHNSVYIGGAPTTGSSNSFAFQSSITTNVRSYLNNIFYNARSNSGSTGKHYAIRVGGTTVNPAGLTSNSNILYSPGTGGNVGLFNAVDQTTLSNWTTATGKDLSSYNSDPKYIAPLATVPDLHINPSVSSLAEGLGTLIASVTDDFDNQTRSGLTPTDIGADAFNGISPAPSIDAIGITPAGNQCVAVSRNVTADVTPDAAPITSVTINYSFNGAVQTPINMTGGSFTTTSTWSATIPVAVPVNAIVTWTVVVTDGTLTKSAVGTSYQDEPTYGVVITASASPTIVCAGSTTTLTLNASQSGIATLGNTSGTPINTTGTPYRTGTTVGNQTRTQYLVLASELIAAGFSTGNLQSMSFNVSNVPTGVMTNFSIGMASTTASVLSSNFLTPSFTNVYTVSSYTPVAGVNTHSFSTPFFWDGFSNVVINVCGTLGTSGSGTTLFTSTTPGGIIATVANSTATGCTDATGTTLTNQRPQFMFSGNLAGTLNNFSWSNGSVIGTTNPVVTTVTANTTYTGTAQIGGCPVTATVDVASIPLPSAPTAINSSQCGVAVPSASISGGASYNWYASPTSTTVLQSGADANYTTAIGATTTWYVTSVNGTCESSRTAITTTVSLPDAVTATTSASNLCINAINSVTLTAVQTGTNNAYNFSWDASPASGSGMPTTMFGGTVNIAPTSIGNYIYSVTATDGICTTISTVTLVVNDLPVVNASANPTVICSGANVTLNGTTPAIGAGMVTIGTATSLTGATSQPTAFCNRWLSYRMQTVYTAAELTAAGLVAGNITSVSYSISTLGDGATNPNYTVKCGTTTATAFTNFIATTGFSTVFTPAVYTHSVGLNTIAFNTPYFWDGTSNLVIEVSHDGADLTNNAQTYYTPTAVNTVAYSTNGSATGTPSLNRLNIIIGGQKMTENAGDLAWQWNPGAINSNTAIVTPVNTGSVATTENYTVTATNTVTGCSNTATTSIVINPVPSTPVVTDGVQCGIGVPTASVSGGSLYYWYASPTSTVVLQSGASSNYSTSISSTTTWYVSSSNGSCMSPRAAVTQTVNTPPAFTLNNPAAICAGSEIGTFSVTSNTADFDTYVWSPTANIYSDAAATTAYSGSNATQVYVKSLTPGVLTINASATNSVSGCAAIASTTISIKNAPTSITVSATPTVICAGNTTTLTAGATPLPVILLNEGFNGATNSWSTTNNSTGGTAANAAWTLRNSPYTSNTGTGMTSNDASQFYLTDSDAQGSGGTTSTVLQSPSINTMGMSTLNLSFFHYYNYYTTDVSAKVEVSTNGTTWTSLQDYKTGAVDIGTPTSFTMASFNMNAYVNKPTVYVRFNYNSAYGYGWAVDNILINGMSTNAYDFSWTSSPAGFTSTSSSATDMPTGTTDYSVVITNTNTACSNSGVVTVSVNPIPSVMAMASSPSVCAGTSATLTAMSATNYTWSSGGNGMTEVVSPSTMTTYTLYGETNGCVGTDMVTVGVNSLPAVTAMASSTLLCSNFGESAVLTASTSATSFTWSNGANTMTTSVTPTSGTTYTVVVNDGNCDGMATVFVDAQICMGINGAVSVSEINVYPNPTNGILNVSISSELSGNTSIEVYDGLGKLAIKENLSNDSNSISLSKLEDGIYIFKIMNNNKAIKVGKVVKQ